jgi:acetyltransferase-like isoleucine patch superfamily enzyme
MQFLASLKHSAKAFLSLGCRPPAGLSDRILYHGKYTYGLDTINLMSWPGQVTYLRVGSFCSIAANVTVLLGGEHRTDWLSAYPFGHIHRDVFPSGEIHGVRRHPATKGDVIIANDVWVGYGSTILSGVTLGSGSCIGAMSVVTRSIPPYAIAAGNPARVIRYRFAQEIIDSLLELRWWDMPDEQINVLVPFLQSRPDEGIMLRLKRMIDSRSWSQG